MNRPRPAGGEDKITIDANRRALAAQGLRDLALLDTPPEEVFDRITRLAARLLDAPVALVTFVDFEGDRQFFKSRFGVGDLSQTPLTHSFCQLVVKTEAPLIVSDAQHDPRVSDNPAVSELGVSAYLGAPLLSLEQLPLGALCVIDRKPRAWTGLDLELLADLAQLAQREIGFRQEFRRRQGAEARLGVSEADFAMLAASIPQLAWMADAQGSIFWYNQRWFEFTGKTMADMKGWGWRSVHHPDHEAAVVAKISRCFETGEDWEDTFPLRGADGKYRWFLSRAKPIRDAAGRPVRWFGTNTDITDRLEAEERQALLTREIDHRAKNALAVAQAVVRLSKADDAQSLKQVIEARVSSLARAHRLLADSRWEGADLRQLLREELAAFGGEDPGRVTLNGPHILLRAATAQSIALVFHELSTNAVKHGALSAPGGKLEVTWDDPGGGDLRMTWLEDSPLGIKAPERSGFGTTLLEQIVQRQFGGSMDNDWTPRGLHCRFTIPATAVPSFEVSPARADERTGRASILLLEDDSLIAMDMEDRIRKLGYKVIGPAATLQEARKLAGATPLDGAVLDGNIDGETSVGLAGELAEAGIPITFCTGYERIEDLPERLQSTPILRKPVSEAALAGALAAMTAQRLRV